MQFSADAEEGNERGDSFTLDFESRMPTGSPFQTVDPLPASDTPSIVLTHWVHGATSIPLVPGDVSNGRFQSR